MRTAHEPHRRAVSAASRRSGRKAFIPFLTAGDPDLAATPTLARSTAGRARRQPDRDRLSLQRSHRRRPGDPGVVHARPGPRPASSTTSSPARGRSPPPRSSPSGRSPLVGDGVVQPRSTAAAPETFLDQAQAAGFSGAIVPDLPFEESDEPGATGRRPRLQADPAGHADDAARRAPRASPSVRPAFSTASASPASPASATGCRRNCSSNSRWLREQTDVAAVRRLRHQPAGARAACCATRSMA